MSEAARLIEAINNGDPHAARELLPMVYDALRKLAAQRMSNEKPGQTLQATALVHEVYLRLVEVDPAQRWNGRGHFFAAAAEAMRRILIERARRGQRVRHGGGRARLVLERLDSAQLVCDDAAEPMDELLALDEALTQLTAQEPQAADVVKLRYFAGLSIEQSAEALGISVRTANRDWAFAKAWLYKQLASDAAE